MKKTAVLLLTIALLATFVACAGETDSTAAVPAIASASSETSSISQSATDGEVISQQSESVSSVSSQPIVYAEVAAVELDSQSVVTLSMGETSQIRAAAVPDNVMPEHKVIAFTSDNPTVATVSKTGLVAYIAEGTAKVTATSINGKQIVVTVTCKPDMPPIPSSVSSEPAVSKQPDKVDSFDYDNMLELETTDPRVWKAGMSPPMLYHYDGSQSLDQVYSEISEMVKVYGYTVMGSGMINNGSSTDDGYIRIRQNSDGRFGIVIYNWRKSSTDSGMNKSINSALVTMKYFLGDENGKTLWKFVDYTQTKAMKASAAKDTLGISDVESAETSAKGEFTFEDGASVEYDCSESRQIIFYFN